MAKALSLEQMEDFYYRCFVDNIQDELSANPEDNRLQHLIMQGMESTEVALKARLYCPHIQILLDYQRNKI